MKVEIDPEEAFKAVIEELDSDRRYIAFRNKPERYVSDLIDKVTKMVSAGAIDYYAEAQFISDFIKSREEIIPYLKDFGIVMAKENGDESNN